MRTAWVPLSIQYNNIELTLQDGSQHVGRVMSDDGKTLKIAGNPFDVSQTADVEKSLIKKSIPSKISPMPPGLISPLNPQALKDLILFLTE